VALGLASVIGLAMFAWPLVLPASGATTPTVQSPYFFVVVVGIIVALALTQVLDGGLDAKALAMLGVLSAVNAALRPLGAGLGGFETVFFILILAGRVFGPGFGFLLGCTSLFASALLTAGVGPWLPFQMLAAAWIGLAAGALPDGFRGKPLRGPGEIAMLAVLGVVAGYLYGFVMNLWFWPFLAGNSGAIGYLPGAPLLENLRRFVLYCLATSAAVWDTVRAATNAVLIVILGPGVLAVFRRAVRRANFAPDVKLEPIDHALLRDLR